jgi:hypothetical protein
MCQEFAAEEAARTFQDGVQRGGTHFHSNGFMNNQNTKLWVPENPYRVLKASFHPEKCTTWCAISKQRAYRTDLCRGHHNKPAVHAATAKWGYNFVEGLNTVFQKFVINGLSLEATTPNKFSCWHGFHTHFFGGNYTRAIYLVFLAAEYSDRHYKIVVQ